MARQGVDRAAIAEAAYALAEERGLAGLGIRSVAEACGVSVGTIYNYFPTKDDLLVEVIGTFWQRAFHEDLCLIVEGERFDAFVSRVYAAMSSALAAFRSDWLPQISALSIQGRDEGKMRESATFDHIRAGAGRGEGKQVRVRRNEAGRGGACWRPTRRPTPGARASSRPSSWHSCSRA